MGWFSDFWEEIGDQAQKFRDELTGKKDAEEEAARQAAEAERLALEREARNQKALDEMPTKAIDTATRAKRGRSSTLLTGGSGSAGNLGGSGSRSTLLGS
jgi:hypothetical protein